MFGAFPTNRRYGGIVLVCVLAWGGCFSLVRAAEALEQQLLAKPKEALAKAAREQGDAQRGALLFHQSTMTCAACHSVGEREDSIGPDLTKVDKLTLDAAVVESILEPSKVISPNYATTSLETDEGQVLTGLVASENAEQVLLRGAADPTKLIPVKKSSIVRRQPVTLSIMPTAQVNALASEQQFLDLVRYLIELRDGGVERARELQPAPSSQAPDVPLVLRPAVQRGDVRLKSGAKFPRAVALGFVGGTVLFDADQLATVATWNEGFLRHSPQNYFGLDWHQQGGEATVLETKPQPLAFRLPGQEEWQAFEAPLVSDPNTGTRFEGYQIGKSAVRLSYRLRVGTVLVAVNEEVRAETRPEWQGFSRRFELSGLPPGAKAMLALPAGESPQVSAPDGTPAKSSGDVSQAPLLVYRDKKATWAARAEGGGTGASWMAPETKRPGHYQLVSAAAKDKAPVTLRIDLWKYRADDAAPKPAELVALVANPPLLNDDYARPVAPLSLPPAPVVKEVAETVAPSRPAVKANENIDEIAPVTARFLRFSITGTDTARSEPGLDELEVYGADAKVNLALTGKASASSVLPGYAIHQIAHLNDGQLGNKNSWISNERGGGWAQIEFPAPVEVRRIVWARDRTGVCKDRLAHAYRIEVSSDGKAWTTVGTEAGRAAGESGGAVRRDATPGYVMEKVLLPFASCRPSDIAFSDDGVLYAIAMTEGQVWRTRTPPPGKPEQVNWQRFAAGLYHPIGIALVDGRVYVAQKEEITELIDRDGDGFAEQYRTVASGWALSSGWHEYCFGLGVDPANNLWFTLNTGHFWPPEHEGICKLGRWRGSIMRIEHGTEKLEEMATGCRVPNGITQGPGGRMFFTDNQGDWIPVCKLAAIVPGNFYGHPEEDKHALAAGQFPSGKSTLWLPYDRSRSASAPVHDTTAGKFGPFAGQMFLGDVGYGANPGILRASFEEVEGQLQGACYRFIDEQPLGCERMKFGPDHQLYMASLTTGITRVAYAGKEPPLEIHSLRVLPKGEGFLVKFTRPLAADTKIEPADIAVKRYHYNYWRNYGSPRVDEQNTPPTAAELSSDRTEMKLKLPVEAHPFGMVYEMNFGKLNDENGKPLLHNEAWYTVQKIPQQ